MPPDLCRSLGPMKPVQMLRCCISVLILSASHSRCHPNASTEGNGVFCGGGSYDRSLSRGRHQLKGLPCSAWGLTPLRPVCPAGEAGF